MSAAQPVMPALPSLVSTTSMAITVLFEVLATGAVGLRLYSRSKISSTSRLAADDYFIIFALVFAWGLLITAIVTAAQGGINTIKGNPLDSIPLFLKVFFVEPLMEFPGQACMRISVLLFYKKIFVTKSFRIVCNVCIGIIASWGISAFITNLTGIRPITDAWNPMGKWDIDFNAFSIAIGSIGIFLDVLTLCLPLPVIHRLHMSTRNKVMTVGILWLGVFCVVADSVRLYYTVKEVHLAVDADGAQRYLLGRSVWLWDRIAPCASIIAACLPTYGPIFRGRNILESMVRSAASWLSFRSNSPATSRVSGQDRARTGTSGSETDSQKNLRSWERLHDDKGSASAHIASQNIPLEDQLGRAEPNNGVTVTSTVDVEHSKKNGNGREYV